MRFAIALFFFFVHVQSSWSQSCKGLPHFIAELGFDISKSAIISSDARHQGALLVQYIDPNRPHLGLEKQYNHPSWKKVGYAGSITRDKNGNTFVLSIPMVNTLLNPEGYWENLHYINSQTGEMNIFVQLPVLGEPTQENLHGQMGIVYDCDSDQLYISNISGSTRKDQKGVITLLDIKSKKTKNILTNIDVMGLSLWKYSNRKFLILGSARSSQIFSIELTKNNEITGQLIPIISLDGVGPRGDDRARKIQITANGVMKVWGVPFYYNMTAPTFKQESIYTFQFDTQRNNWVLVSIQS